MVGTLLERAAFYLFHTKVVYSVVSYHCEHKFKEAEGHKVIYLQGYLSHFMLEVSVSSFI